ncbi:hypothetical protein CFOL_v3_32503 [Cephalotus follicularis]|uniref:Uncharacterized protein n=1 Tax=Cephalotus follicularis TaxID=3775 RepID=A0A1Q3D9U5_CEPFO|nr:hypothetical protein CFOL_v3_32503 [Cephalotus follicularis]
MKNGDGLLWLPILFISRYEHIPRSNVLPRHGIKNMPGRIRLPQLSIPIKHSCPRNDIHLLHYIKQSFCFFNVPTFRKHIKHCITQNQVHTHPIPFNVITNPLPKFQILLLCTSRQNTNHCHNIRLHIFRLHSLKVLQGFLRTTPSCKARYHRIPRNNIFLSNPPKHPVCRIHIPTLSIKMYQGIQNEQI